jgi:hypothetical protein
MTVKTRADRKADAIAAALQSGKFLAWRPVETRRKDSNGRGRDFTSTGPSFKNLAADEKHFSPNELSKAWGVSAETVRTIFRTEPGVLRLGQPVRGRRSYVLLRIPQSVAERVHRRLSATPL